MKLLYALLIMLAGGLTASAQCWTSPVTQTTEVGATGSSNTFDWTQEFGTVYLRDEYDATLGYAPARSLTMPMYSQSSLTYQNLNLLEFQVMPAAEKDHMPADGWELLAYDFGEPSPKDRTAENPFYAIYNRYTGKIRVYIMLTTKANSLGTGAYLKLSFTNSPRRTALLQHINPIGQPVMRMEPGLNMNVPNYIANKDYFWFYADFAAAYDPCTCELTDDSYITISLNVNQDATIEAEINGTVHQTAVNSNSQPGSKENNVAMSFDDVTQPVGKVIDGAKKVFESYKTYDNYRKQFEKAIDQTDAYFVSKIDSQLKKKYPTGSVTLEGSTYAANVAALKADPKGVKLLQGYNYAASALGNFKGVAQAIPYVGAVIGLIDFISSMEKKEEAGAAAPKPTPMNFDVDLSLKGTIKMESMINSYTFRTPGSDNGSGAGYPTYNNILGVINLMEVPHLEYVEYTPVVGPNQDFAIPSDLRQDQIDFLGNIRQYRFSDELKYVLNPAANLDLISAEATFILQFDSGVVFVPNPMNNNLMRDIDMMPVEFGHPNLRSTNYIPARMESQGWETDYLSNGYFNYLTNINGNAPNDGMYRIRTPYTGLQCMRKTSFTLWKHNGPQQNSTNNNICCRDRAPRLSLKVIYKLRKKNSVDDDVITLVHSYDLKKQLADATQFHPPTPQTYDLGIWRPSPQSVVYPMGFTNPPIFPSAINAPVDVVLSNTVVTQDIYAQKTITINDGVYITNNAGLYAGEKIITNVTSSNSSYGIPYSSFNIGLGARCDRMVTFAAQSDADIALQCNSTQYSQLALARPAGMATNTDTMTTSIEDSTFSLSITPNPFKSSVTVKGYLSSQSPIEVVFFNSVGAPVRRQHFLHIGGEFQYSVDDMGQLTPGVYLVKFITNRGTIVRRITKYE